MTFCAPNRRWIAVTAAVFLCAGLHAGAKRKTADTWQLAEEAKQTLLTMPAGERKRADYTVVMDAYRVIYHGDPQNLHAPDAVFAVASLLAEEGRSLHSEKDSQNAIGQFEFLRKNYPYSSLRIRALYEEGLIAENDLHDHKQAKEKFALYVSKYGKHEDAAAAQSALVAIQAGKPLEGSIAASAPPVEIAATVPQAKPIVIAQAKPPEDTSTLPPAKLAAKAGSPIKVSTTPISDSMVPGPQHAVAQPSGKRALVSGIRHWSTPSYTRVAIDLGEEVQYEAARVPRPDRIFFDLHNTKLGSELAGKSFNVTDDGILKRIRAAQYSNDVTRVVLDVNDVTEYSAFLLPNPYRLIIDIHGKSAAQTAAAAPVTPDVPAAQKEIPPSNLKPVDHLNEMLHGKTASSTPATAVPTVPSTVATHTPASSNEVATIDLTPGKERATHKPTSGPIAETVAPKDEVKIERKTRGKSDPAVPVQVASPTQEGERSLVRALGLKIGRIVIDAGHGGHDSGTLGVDGLMEKDVALDVALRLGKLLHERLGAEIIYTRSDDTFIPLETRTAIANKAQADLFISVHCNSSPEPAARGVEVYYLNFTQQSDALEVAARENAVSDQGVYQLADLVKKITLKDKVEESREFATDVDKSLFDGLSSTGLRNRGVKKAPFVVLIGANMPSVLAEISFVTNPKDATALRKPEYRERVAESLYKGVAKYANSLGGMRMASADKATSGGGR